MHHTLTKYNIKQAEYHLQSENVEFLVKIDLGKSFENLGKSFENSLYIPFNFIPPP